MEKEHVGLAGRSEEMILVFLAAGALPMICQNNQSSSSTLTTNGQEVLRSFLFHAASFSNQCMCTFSRLHTD